MKMDKYRLDLGSIIDQEKNIILSDIQVRNSLNKYHTQNKKLKLEKQELLSYNSACEDTLMDIEVTLDQMIKKAEKECTKRHEELECKVFSGGSRTGKCSLLDQTIYWRGYVKGLKQLQKEIFHADKKM